METWKASKNFPGYSVSDKGRIRSEARHMIRSNGRPHSIPNKMISLTPDGQGYLQAHPYRNKKRFHVQVHREVFETFVRPLAPGEQIDHMDSDKKNNELHNLQAVPGSKEHAKLTYDRIRDEAFKVGYQKGLEDAKL